MYLIINKLQVNQQHWYKSYRRNLLTRKIRATRTESATAPRVATSRFESIAGEFDEVSSVESQKRIEAVLSQHFCFTCVYTLLSVFQNFLVFPPHLSGFFEVRLVQKRLKLYFQRSNGPSKDLTS